MAEEDSPRRKNYGGLIPVDGYVGNHGHSGAAGLKSVSPRSPHLHRSASAREGIAALSSFIGGRPIFRIKHGSRGVKPLFVIPHEKERDDVEEAVGEDSAILHITTPGQLTALINDSVGVIVTNTAALQLAIAREKPSIALFSSEEKAEVFVPEAIQKRCVIISSSTGKLIDIDTKAVKNALQIFERTPVLAY